MKEYIVGLENEHSHALDVCYKEELIRCKDCKYWGADGYRYGCKYATDIMFENDYCSWAERKNDA